MGTPTSRRAARSATLMAGALTLFGCAGATGGGSGECTYENGNTYMEEYNHCQQMIDRGIQCIVPAPPIC